MRNFRWTAPEVATLEAGYRMAAASEQSAVYLSRLGVEVIGAIQDHYDIKSVVRMNYTPEANLRIQDNFNTAGANMNFSATSEFRAQNGWDKHHEGQGVMIRPSGIAKHTCTPKFCCDSDVQLFFEGQASFLRLPSRETNFQQPPSLVPEHSQ
jgi:hypothetical protein